MLKKYNDIDASRDIFILILLVFITFNHFIGYLNNKTLDNTHTIQKILMNNVKNQNDINEINLKILNHLVNK